MRKKVQPGMPSPLKERYNDIDNLVLRLQISRTVGSSLFLVLFARFLFAVVHSSVLLAATGLHTLSGVKAAQIKALEAGQAHGASQAQAHGAVQAPRTTLAPGAAQALGASTSNCSSGDACTSATQAPGAAQAHVCSRLNHVGQRMHQCNASTWGSACRWGSTSTCDSASTRGSAST